MSAAALPAGAADDGLVFQWQGRAYSRWRLALMLLLSLLVHAASFYILQVSYTPTGSLLPPPAQVLFVSPGSAEDAALAHWIDVANPSLMTQPRALSPGQILGTLGFHYVPSYATALQVFKPLPPQQSAEAPPLTRKPGPVPAGLLPPLTEGRDRPPSPPPVASHTRILLTGGIDGLLTGSLSPVPAPVSRSTQPLERTIFLVGVPPGGGPAWIFQQASSGDDADNGADADARDYLARLRFKAPGGAGTQSPAWGWATFYWGRDAYP